MKTLGVLTAISRGGYLVVKLKSGYNGGRSIVDITGKRLGEVKRVIGPVKSPYLIIKPTVGGSINLNREIGNQVILIKDDKERSRRVRTHRGIRSDNYARGRL